MNEAKCDKASRKYTIITILGITSVVFLMLVSIAGAAQSLNIWSHKGSELINSEKYNEAIKAYDKAIEINPHDSYAWDGKGVALGKLGKSDEAKTAFDKAIEIYPQYSKAWYNKGLALDQLNKYDEAIKAFDKAIEVNPHYSAAWYNKAV